MYYFLSWRIVHLGTEVLKIPYIYYHSSHTASGDHQTPYTVVTGNLTWGKTAGTWDSQTESFYFTRPYTVILQCLGTVTSLLCWYISWSSLSFYESDHLFCPGLMVFLNKTINFYLQTVKASGSSESRIPIKILTYLFHINFSVKPEI